jgi:hypothetical protein
MNKGQLVTSCMKYWGLSGYLKFSAPCLCRQAGALAFATAGSDAARSPQPPTFLLVSAGVKECNDVRTPSNQGKLYF